MKLLISKYIANGKTVSKAKKNLAKLKVKGPIAPIPVVWLTNAVPQIKEAISIKTLARMLLIKIGILALQFLSFF